MLNSSSLRTIRNPAELRKQPALLRPVKLLQQLALFFAELGRCIDDDADDVRAARFATQARHAVS